MRMHGHAHCMDTRQCSIVMKHQALIGLSIFIALSSLSVAVGLHPATPFILQITLCIFSFCKLTMPALGRKARSLAPAFCLTACPPSTSSLFFFNQALGRKARSLASLTLAYCSTELDKSYQAADWRRRPLPDDYVAYARADVRYLLYLCGVLRWVIVGFA